MPLADRIRDIINPLPPGSAVLLTRDFLAGLLEEEPASSTGVVVCQLDTAAMAGRLGCSESAVRGYCRRRVIPTARKVAGLGWLAEEPAFEAWRLGVAGSVPEAPPGSPGRGANRATRRRRLGDYRLRGGADKPVALRSA
ncbi:MAG TPA: hypothetical protein VFR37_08490 [Longimicrobium sp.]|nr:hypothetical protein [Longimicrobium sp.]